MPPSDPFTTTWVDLAADWWPLAAGLVVLGLWGASRRDAQRRRAAETEQERRADQAARRAADLPRAAPGAWRLRCTRCQESAAAAAVGVLRIGALGSKYTLGRCPFCERLGWLAIERATLRGVGSGRRRRARAG